MAFAALCELKNLRRGYSAAFASEGQEIILLWPYDGELKAFSGLCPHQKISLADALFDGKTLTCQLHHWVFDAKTGQSRPPRYCKLSQYPLRIEADTVLVDICAEVID